MPLLPRTSLPALHGGLLALLAALLFGASAPLVQGLGRGLGPFTTAALLYAGAALAGAALRQPADREAALTRADIPALLGVAACGAVLGPVAWAWGLQHTGATGASLLLTLEVVFTAVLARLTYHEQLGPRVSLAMVLLITGAAALVADTRQAGTHHLAGLLAVVVATFAWALDNTGSRRLAERDPGQVVLVKSVMGAAATAVLALLMDEPRPGAAAAAGLLALGASAYGLSLRCYLLAQRAIGAARTGSVFAFAPFIGAALAWGLGDRGGSGWLLGGGALMTAGIVLHLAESHAHEHAHEALAHEHAHRHDDGHHGHAHVDPPAGPHSHWHRHAPLLHVHPHGPDAHHGHRHDAPAETPHSH